MRTIGFFAGALCALSTSNLLADTDPFCAGIPGPDHRSGIAAKALSGVSAPLPSHGRIHAVVIFAKFNGEAPGADRAPDSAAAMFDADLPGSFSHFYDAMSFEQLAVEATVLPKRYESERPATAYLAGAGDMTGDYGRFVEEILLRADDDIDFSIFDNDGPDGLPSSGDDDGGVDYVFIELLSAPRGFIAGGATGIAGLGDGVDFVSADSTPDGSATRITGSRFRGAMVQEGTFAQTVGAMAHEFGHALGLPDLYDTAYSGPADDSAGIGRWGLMGWGAQGWNGDDGPNPFCAWSLQQLGWIGIDNERFVEVQEDEQSLILSDLRRGGSVLRIPLRNGFIAPRAIFSQEYLLLEHRTRGGSYYNRNLPSEGMLVWHVNPWAGNNTGESSRLVDLVCADGLYANAGYPLGRAGDANSGWDNLDFWAHDAGYASSHAGNLGDATDPFDGIRYSALGIDSNPSTDRGSMLPAASTGLALRNISRRGEDIVLDIALPRWSGTITGEVHWMGNITVSGDLNIAPEGKLTIYGHTTVRFAATDRLASGLDPARCELHVDGELSVFPGKLTRWDRPNPVTVPPGTVTFESLRAGATWFGILPSESADLDVPSGSLDLRDAEFGLLEPGVRPALATDRPTAVLEEAAPQPAAFELLPNYPNPFNPATTISFTLPEMSRVRLSVHNALGQVVRTLVDGSESSGTHEVVWDGLDEAGREAASGVYLYRIEVVGSDQFSQWAPVEVSPTGENTQYSRLARMNHRSDKFSRQARAMTLVR